MLFKDWTGEGDVLRLRIAPLAKKGSLRPEMIRYIGKRFPVLVEQARASLGGPERRCNGGRQGPAGGR